LIDVSLTDRAGVSPLRQMVGMAIIAYTGWWKYQGTTHGHACSL